MKRNGSESEVGESSWTLVNSLSKHTDDREAESRDTENTALPLMTSRRQVIELNVTEHEDSEPKKEDLERIIELMDGFKASKVFRDKLYISILLKLSVMFFHSEI